MNFCQKKKHRKKTQKKTQKKSLKIPMDLSGKYDKKKLTAALVSYRSAEVKKEHRFGVIIRTNMEKGHTIFRSSMDK